MSEAPAVLERNLSWTVGAVRITAVLESDYAFPPNVLLPGATAEELAAIGWLKPRFLTADGMLPLWVQAFVVETPTRRIVVDTCMGNDKPRTGGAGDRLQTDFLQRFEAAGFPCGSIDVVLCTHLHIDHVGWNTRLEAGRWVPTFPHARYLIARTELEHWREAGEGDAPAIFADSVQPILDAGLVDLVETDHRICDEVRLVPTPGHTPGHVSVAIESAGRRAFITGDMTHHPAQIARPDWTTLFDHDPAAAIATRRAMLGVMAGEGVLVIGTHFPAPTAGRVVRDGETFRFEP